MAISVYSLNVMKYMENRITQWINSALYDKGTNLIRPIFEISITHCRIGIWSMSIVIKRMTS